jgi:L-fuconate dehydratase
MTVITNVRILDVRFPTSERLDGSDAMNPDPDYSAAYVVLETDSPGLEGHGLTSRSGGATKFAVRPSRQSLRLSSDWNCSG